MRRYRVAVAPNKNVHPLLQKLEGGDRRSIGRSEEVAEEVLHQPDLFQVLVDGLFLSNQIIRMRSSDALEKATKDDARYLLPYKSQLIKLAAEEEQNEVRWHLAQILPRLNLSRNEKIEVTDTLLAYLSASSSIVNASVMQALSDIAETDNLMRETLLVHIEELTAVGTPAMKARGRKLLAKFNSNNKKGPSDT